MRCDLIHLGVTHRTAPLAIRESMRPSVEKQAAILARLSGVAHGRMVLSTCERFELFAQTSRLSAAPWIADLADWFHLPLDLLARHTLVLRGRDAADHLLRVSAGLESRVLGEPQVLGQVKVAYQAAIDAAATDCVLASLGRTAIRAGKRVRAETPLNRGGRSIASVSIEALQRWVRPEGGRAPALAIVGSGQMAADVVRASSVLRGWRLVLVARNVERAREISQGRSIEILPFEALAGAVAGADALVTCTSAANYLVDAASIGASRTNEICMIDLAVPRNVDPTAVQLPCVRLLHLDDLLAAEASRPEQASALAIIEEELGRFERWRRERRVAPLIAGMVNRASASSSGATLEAKRSLHRRIMRLKDAAGGRSTRRALRMEIAAA